MVHLQVDFDWSTQPLHDVIATIPGSSIRDQWILYGNHHDAWVNGASAIRSAARPCCSKRRALSRYLRKQGWQPKRTIVFALWDGEEYGLMGSTEWVEKHMEELDRNAAVYINSDTTGRGPLSSRRLAQSRDLLTEVLRDVRIQRPRRACWTPRADRRTPVVAIAGGRANRGSESFMWNRSDRAPITWRFWITRESPA